MFSLLHRPPGLNFVNVTPEYLHGLSIPEFRQLAKLLERARDATIEASKRK